MNSLSREPVNARNFNDNSSLFLRFLLSRNSLIDCWPSYAYESKHIKFRLLSREYHVLNSPSLIRTAFLDERFDRKSSQNIHAIEPLVGDGLLVSDGDLWKERRRRCKPVFDHELMEYYSKTIVKATSDHMSRWDRLDELKCVNMSFEMSVLTATIISKAVFGDRLKNSELSQLVEGFSSYQGCVGLNDIADAFDMKMLFWFKNPIQLLQVSNSSAKVHKIIDLIVKRYREEALVIDLESQPECRSDLLNLLLQKESFNHGIASKCPLSISAAKNEAMVFFLAGHETTATSLSWTWYLLDHSPHIAIRLREELDTVLKGRLPTIADVPRLVYTRAVFEESMRLYPPIPLLSREIGDWINLEGLKLRPRSNILVIPWLMHRHKSYWQNPNQFCPERFLPDKPRPDPYVFLPFSAGRRSCLGQSFGMLEGILCLATLMQRYTAKIAPGHKVAIDSRLSLRPRGGLPMLLEQC